MVLRDDVGIVPYEKKAETIDFVSAFKNIVLKNSA